MDKTITLPEEDWQFILETLRNVEDKGPANEGWQSDELMALCGKLSRHISIIELTPEERRKSAEREAYDKLKMSGLGMFKANPSPLDA